MITTTSDSHALAGLKAGSKATSPAPQSLYARYFFVAMSVLFIAVTALGFVPQLVAIHASHIHLHWFTHVHGAIMTVWLLIFLAQALLGAFGRLKYHRQLGFLSVGLGTVVWITMGVVTVSALIRDNPPEGDGQFTTLALSLSSVALFGFFSRGAFSPGGTPEPTSACYCLPCSHSCRPESIASYGCPDFTARTSYVSSIWIRCSFR
jgi:magnesium-transporting ATPase (P-type)